MPIPESVAEEAVRDLLSHLLLVPADQIGRDQRLIQDLRVDGDDLAMWFIQELWKRLRVPRTLELWQRVVTVDDAVRLVSEHGELI